MASTKALIPSSILRGIQALFGIIILGLTVELIKGHNPTHESGLSHVPALLPFAAVIGGLTFAGALAGFVLAWTEFLRGYFEVVIDIVVLLENLAGGVLVAIRLQGKNCADASDENRYGSGGFPVKDALGSIDILTGGCSPHGCWYLVYDQDQLNKRCKKSQADSVLMFLTVVVLFVVLALTYMRMKRAWWS